MSLTVRVLVGLVAGLSVGMAISVVDLPWLSRVADVAEPIGTLFINAIRMTVIPLVVSSLVVGIAASADTRDIGRVGGRAAALFVTLIVVATGMTAIVAAPLMARLRLDPEVVATLRESARSASASATETARTVPGLAEWVVSLVPANPVGAAADGAMLPVIVFSLAFGLALSRVDRHRRESVLGFFHGVLGTMLMLVHWILEFAPIGVFALAVPLAARMGVAAAGTLAYYVVLVGMLTVTFVAVVLYPLAVVVGRVSLPRFARACAPAQAVALSARSSLAALPAMIDGAKSLGLSVEVTGFLIPLAASVFRVGSAIGQTVGVLFAAQLYGATPEPAQLTTIVFTVAVTTFSIPGVPAGSIVAMVPILMAANLPVEGIGVLLGVDTIPDMFRTAANVTGGMAAATVLGGGSRDA